MQFGKLLGGAFLVVTLVIGVDAVQASSHGEDHSSADSKVEEREMLMEGIGGSMGALGCYVKGQCDELKPKIAKRLAMGIAAMAQPSVEAFRTPTPMSKVKTTATPDIWKNWDKFEDGLMMMGDRAKELAKAIKGGDKVAVKAAMGELGKTCKGCHDDFREKE
ncbi:MAG: cytochrome c [Magnetococcales bacterium]|nr:cytochrome c [Magnetococcales bacterium]